ncbi:MAG: leucyl/phenylalanyl-tRNA--protein transferase [Ignavibacteriae bacterium]|nr:leucyl/phenylalanyl-tRNA--protein transferase [Ignavibacteriota bacterium]MCB9207050.1 leucyl/phenylalanyl-tRNA--protein transferase [Ignavibacteriales bacterium]MCB9207799.1 leucyl/phenylalanyl-tRNA--protein transferase [Ignavibacteriales bacterium]MCB9258569.1 leucyl/phenylalanyl-tRNA--protein transferase [Ignavibacteriales bacterium]
MPAEFDKDQLLKPINMLNLYAQGAFPMGDENGEIDWYQPKTRTIIPIENYNIPRSLRKFMGNSNFEFKFDEHTIDVVKNCADRDKTWITPKLIEAYKGIQEIGFLHSVEVYCKNKLVGGLYGVSIGGAFFGESMFSHKSQASKSALVKLLKRLEEKEFTLLDIQFMTPHLEMFGAIEIDFEEYNDLLDIAYTKDVSFL